MDVADLVPVLSCNLRGFEAIRKLDANVIRLESRRAHNDKAFVRLGYTVEYLVLFLIFSQQDGR